MIRANEIPCTIKMNEYTDCKTFNHDSHMVYYCHVVTAGQFCEAKKADKEINSFLPEVYVFIILVLIAFLILLLLRK